MSAGGQGGSQTLPHRRIVCGRVLSADFFGASPVASALGIRSGATPRGQSITAAGAIGARQSYNGRRYWPFVCTMEPCWQAALMAS